MDSSNKLISIIMPTYNVEHYIIKTITSILSQKSQNYKLIIVDDHSTDKTVEVINKNFAPEIQNNIINIIVLNQNSGPGTARQIGLDNVNTPYVTFIDSDDSYLSTNIISLLETNIKQYNPDCIMFKYITDHGHIKIKKNYKLPENRLLTIKEAFIQKINNPHPIWHYIWNKCYKTDIIKQYQVHFQKGVRVAEDVRFNEDFLTNSQNLLFINQYQYLYNCTNSQSISKCSSQKKDVSIDYFYKYFEHECSQFERFSQYTRTLNCEKECTYTLKHNLCLAITRIFIQSKKYPWHLELKKQIKTTPYFNQVKSLYIGCYIKNLVQIQFNTLKNFIKRKL